MAKQANLSYEDVKKVADSIGLLCSEDQYKEVIKMYNDISADYAEDEHWTAIIEDILYQLD